MAKIIDLFSSIVRWLLLLKGYLMGQSDYYTEIDVPEEEKYIEELSEQDDNAIMLEPTDDEPPLITPDDVEQLKDKLTLGVLSQTAYKLKYWGDEYDDLYEMVVPIESNIKKVVDLVMLRRDKSVMGELPKKEVRYVPVEVDVDAQEVGDMLQELYHNRRAVLFSSHWHFQEKLKEYGLKKVVSAADIIEDLVDSRGPVVAWVYHHKVADVLEEELKSRGLRCIVVDGRKSPDKRFQDIYDFNHGQYDVLIAGLKSVNHGFTITGSNTAVFVQTNYTPTDMRQAEDRIHRIGQEDDVLILYLVGEETGEEHVLQRWLSKEQIAKDILQ